MRKIYIAGPLFNAHERDYLEKIALELENNGYECFLPHRDQTGIPDDQVPQHTMTLETRDKIFNNDLNALEASDITVALLTGQDIDSGTSAEIGFTYANKKPVVAIKASETRIRNLFVEGMVSIAIDDIDQLVGAVSKV
ncbi:nucleoside 2-deoxyribosyltransferase [Paracoccaceae bacterium]|nr:nucleoside 2-deoxyribosyltransferase [Paracoccaceae bacterium]